MKLLERLNDVLAVEQDNQDITNGNSTTMAAVPSIDIMLSSISGDRILQNFRLIWLDNSLIEINHEESIIMMEQLRKIVNNLNKFTDINECIQFMTNIKTEKIFLIFSGPFTETTITVIHDMPEVDAIYILYENQEPNENWIKLWPKIKGVYTNIDLICKELKEAAHDCDHNSISISLVEKNDEALKDNLDTLDSSFMYTQILKEILLTINFDEVHMAEFLAYCQEQFADNPVELRNVKKIEKEYHCHQPIWWYTYESFLYSMLNRALRLMDIELIIKIGFFLKDLHNDIVVLRSEQFNECDDSASFIVYRGQGLSSTDFDKLKKTPNGLLSFNNFLSTSKNSNVSLAFARRTIATSDLIGVFFVIEVNPTIATTPFANVKNVSYFKKEEEILFSMNSIFRIGQVKQIEENTRLWQVDLTLTTDNDPQLHALAEFIREKIFSGYQGWYRLGILLVDLGQFDKAQQVFDIMLDQTMDDNEKGNVYHMLGMIKRNQGNYEDAIEYYEKSIEIHEKYLSSTDVELANSYTNLGLVYGNISDYSNAFLFYEKALIVYQKTLPTNHPYLATLYNNIGGVCDKMNEYAKALLFHEKAHEIYQKTLPTNHPDLATSYNNNGLVYYNIRHYSKALSSYEKALEIRQKILPANHPDLATSYSNIGMVYDDIDEYSKALSYYERALEIEQKTLSKDHPDLATSYTNMGTLYNKMGDNMNALSYYERALDIFQHSLPSNHSIIKNVQKSIEIVKKEL